MMNKELKLFPYKNYFPKLHKSVFLASGVKIIGDVEIDENSSVWYNCVIRGDVHYIKIGKETNIQDCSMLHVTNDEYPLNIGNNVSIAHSVTLHGCKLHDLCLVGMRAVVLDGAVIEENSIVAAGSVVKEKFIVPEGKLVAGVPARIIRNLEPGEIENIKSISEKYLAYTDITIKSLNKNNYSVEW